MRIYELCESTNIILYICIFIKITSIKYNYTSLIKVYNIPLKMSNGKIQMAKKAFEF